MTKLFYSIAAMFMALSISAQPAYYNDVNLSLTGMALKAELGSKISDTHTNMLDYTPDVWNVLKVSDIDPTDNADVLLVYGYDDTDADETNDRTRSKNATGGATTGEWN